MTETIAPPPRIIRHSKQTEPQRRFWASLARYRLLVAGVGAGKTRAGCIECLRQPPGSIGMVLAPTYPMLRDATLRTFLDLVESAGVLREFNKAEMRAELGGSRTVLFRSADRPDRLRGPNLGWFWLDEAALMPHEVWLIMLGRLREEPSRAWCTTTPRGKNWLHKVFLQGGVDYHVTRASSRSNPFIPKEFVQSLLDAYDPTFAAQEVEGEFLDDSFGQLIPDVWVDRLPLLTRPAYGGGPRWLSCDLGEGSGRDSTVILVGDAHGILAGQESPWVGPIEGAIRIARLVRQHDIRQERIVYDAGGGRGLDIEPYLDQHGIVDAIPYRGSKEGGSKFENRRSKVAWALRQRLDPERPRPLPPLEYDPDYVPSEFDPIGRESDHEIQPPFCLPEHRPWWPMLAEELKALRYHHKGKKIALETKEDLVQHLRRSPNCADALLMAMSLEHE